MSDHILRDQFRALLIYPKQPSPQGLKRDTAAATFRSFATTLGQDTTLLPDFERGVMTGILGLDAPSGTTFAQASQSMNRHFDTWWDWHEKAREGL